VKTYKDLIVWQKSKKMAVDFYKNTNSFPREELYGLTSQIRRSAVSVPANIAEGYGRQSTKDYLRFLKISRGSLFELQTLIEISNELEFLVKEQFKKLYEQTLEIDRMLSSLIYKVSENSH
jgi:four helix bundle protein